MTDLTKPKMDFNGGRDISAERTSVGWLPVEDALNPTHIEFWIAYEEYDPIHVGATGVLPSKAIRERLRRATKVAREAPATSPEDLGQKLKICAAVGVFVVGQNSGRKGAQWHTGYWHLPKASLDRLFGRYGVRRRSGNGASDRHRKEKPPRD